MSDGGSRRGVVIPGPVEVDGDTMNVSGALDPLEWRRLALYWDVIDWPSTPIFGFGETSDVAELKESGILVRSQMGWDVIGQGDMTQCYVRAQLAAFRARSAAEPGAWSLSQVGNGLYLPNENTQPLRTVEVELADLLPIPTAEVPIGHVLEFKASRKAELERFRIARDRVYQDITDAGDPARAIETAKSELRGALADINKVLSESLGRRILSSLTVELNLSSAVTATIAAAGAKAALGLSSPLVAAIGVGTALVKVGLKSVRRPTSLPVDLRDFAYIASVKRAFPLDDPSTRANDR